MKKREFTSFEEAVEYLYEVPRFTSKNGIMETREFLHRLGDPDRRLRIIHVAGTNGKGSVCAYMRAVLEKAGKRVAVFTSPHLTDIRERFMLCGKMPSREEFLEAFLQVYEALDWKALEAGEGYHPTFFEYLFFMAMLLFKAQELDYCILETGLGGRLDATNAVSKKAAAVITRISLDHVEYLGDTVEAIAGEKAGIMQAGAPVIFADVQDSVSRVFIDRAKELGIRAFPVSKNDYVNLKFKNKTIDFSMCSQYYDSDGHLFYRGAEAACLTKESREEISLTLHTIAAYQVENAALAVRTLQVIDAGISQKTVQQGIADCFWAGRMEEILPEVYVDGAHNEDGIRAFLETVRQDRADRRKLLFGVVADKDYEHMLSRLLESGLFERVAIARLQNARAASLTDLEKVMSRYEKCAYTLYDNAGTALRALLQERREETLKGDAPARIYVAGSLYLVGEIKELVNHDKF